MLGSCVSFSPDDQLIALSASSEGKKITIDNLYVLDFAPEYFLNQSVLLIQQGL